MNYKLLGKSGMRVSELCLGTMTFGEEWGTGADKGESQKIFELFANAGGNFLDTANYYTQGSSERFLGEFIASDRDYFVVATKYTLQERADSPNGHGNHKKNLKHTVEASLKRLGTDYIDLLWVHMWDFTAPVEEVLRALNDLVRSGKVLHIGISDTPAWVVARGNTLAELRGWEQFVGLQVEYSLIERTVEAELLPMAKEFGMTVTPWSPLGSGMLTGKYLEKINETDRLSGQSEKLLVGQNVKVAQKVVDIAEELDVSAAQVALAWLRAQGGNIVPIIGARKTSQLEDNLGCLNLTLSEEQLTTLNEISKVPLAFPSGFLSKEQVRKHLYGDFWEEGRIG